MSLKPERLQAVSFHMEIITIISVVFIFLNGSGYWSKVELTFSLVIDVKRYLNYSYLMT